MEEKRARDNSSSLSNSDESLCCYYDAPNWKRGAFSFPSGMVGSIGTAYTRAQWLELQRQALIYKHITASVPVPPYLLVPFHYSNAPYCMIGGAGGMVNFGYLVNSTDPEPRRCRRTDGKKWRCSKDAAPDQKYCEHHMHRGKPRSRKLVEAPKSKTPESITATAAAVHCTNSVFVAPSIVKGGVDSSSWNYMGSSGSYGLFGYDEDKSSSLLKHGNTRITEAISDGDTTSKQWCHGSHSFASLNSDLSSISEKPASVPDVSIERGGYIDAWSAEKAATLNSTDNFASLDLQHCGLSLSMSNDHADLGTADPFTAMQSPVTWTNHESSLCGPLGEFFQPHQQLHINVAEEPRAPVMLINEGNEISPEQSPTRRFAWSPTGVLQKTFSSHSDNSNASSPSFVGMGSAIYHHQHVLPDFK